MNNNAIETRDKTAKIYFILGAIFVAIFSSITLFQLFLSALNF